MDPPHRRVEDLFRREAARDLPKERVHEGELLGALALGLEGEGVGQGDRELPGEAGEVLEVVHREARSASFAGRAQDPEEGGRLALAVVVGEGHAEHPGGRPWPRGRAESAGSLTTAATRSCATCPMMPSPRRIPPRVRRARRRGRGSRRRRDGGPRPIVEAEDRGLVGLDEAARLLGRVREQDPQVAKGRGLEPEVVEGRHLPGHPLRGRVALGALQGQGELAAQGGQQVDLVLVERRGRAPQDVEHSERQSRRRAPEPPAPRPGPRPRPAGGGATGRVVEQRRVEGSVGAPLGPGLALQAEAPARRQARRRPPARSRGPPGSARPRAPGDGCVR